MWDTIKNFLRKLAGIVTEPDPATGKTFIEEMAELALPIVEDVANIDLNGDGHVAAKTEALHAAEVWGLKRLRRLVEDVTDPDELRRLLAAARIIPIVKPILDRVGLPLKWKWLEGAVWGAYVLFTEK